MALFAECYLFLLYYTFWKLCPSLVLCGKKRTELAEARLRTSLPNHDRDRDPNPEVCT